MTDRKPPAISEDTPIGPDVDLKLEDVRWASGKRLTDGKVAEIIEILRRGEADADAPRRRLDRRTGLTTLDDTL